MGMFDHLEVEENIEVAKDTLGGFAKIENTGMYECKITKAYCGVSSGGAFSVTVQLETDDGARLNITEYITSGTAKGCKNYYLDKNGKKQYLPGYNKMRSLDVLLTANTKPYPSTTTGMVKIFDFDLKKEIPQEKEVITEWLGKKVKVLVMKKYEDKQVKDATGNYVPTAEVRTIYEVEHFIDADTEQTLNEKTAGSDGFKDAWLAKYGSNFVMDKRELSKHLDPEKKADAQTGTDSKAPAGTDEDDPF